MKYRSRPECLREARTMLRDFKAMLTKDASGDFPVAYEDYPWEAMSFYRPTIDWRNMWIEQRFELLVRMLDDAMWSLEPAKGKEVRDSQKLAFQFIKQEPDYDPSVKINDYDQWVAAARERGLRMKATLNQEERNV